VTLSRKTRFPEKREVIGQSMWTLQLDSLARNISFMVNSKNIIPPSH
jgi:hypothetical protein